MEEADFIPPDPMLVEQALDNWEKYYHADRPDQLVQLAVVHAQFEIIHPFIDGYGRIGRILIPLFLSEKKLLSRPMFYLSAYFEQHREKYIDLLRALGRNPGAWNRWIVFFLQALDEQARVNGRKAQDIIDLYGGLKERVIALTHSQYAVPLLDQIFERPLFQSTHLKFGEGLAPSRQAIFSLLRVLRDDGILKVVREGRGRRAQVLALASLINLCEGAEVF